MRSYEHKKLVERLAELSNAPDDMLYKKWLGADDLLSLVRENIDQEELIIYASTIPIYIYSVLVPNENFVSKVNFQDLLRWSCNPYDQAISYVWDPNQRNIRIDRGIGPAGADALKNGKSLIFGRSFDGLKNTDQNYIELLQEYAHLNDIHWRPEHKGYCKFDQNADVINLVSLTKCQETDMSLVTFLRQPLEDYLIVNRYTLVRMFEFQLYQPNWSGGWSNCKESTIKVDSNFFYRRTDVKDQAAYIRGVQLFNSNRSKDEVISAILHPQEEPARYVEFSVLDWRNAKFTEISTDPRQTTNYFQAEANDLPYETSPAFFRPEVLSKYKADSDKYAVRDRRIECRSTWSLQYDVNKANQVFVYICYLRRLPYQEQLYWKSFNVEPITGISKRAMESDFEGRLSENQSPLTTLFTILDQWNRAKVGYWKLRDPNLLDRVSVPYAGNRDEWSRAFVELSKLVIEGFDVKFVRNALREMNLSYEPDDRTLSLIENYLSHHGDTENRCVKLEGLRTAQRIRSKIGSHVQGEDAEKLTKNTLEHHDSFTAHFNSVCEQIINELRQVEIAYRTSAEVIAGHVPE